MKEPYKIDVPVLLIFFSRPEQFRKVFEQVKVARPSKLYLYQDGPREGRQDDVWGINACRKIVEDIEWECKVYKFYQKNNVGCDPSEFIAQKWMFEKEEMGIVLEDDDVPTQSFFLFCKELLEKYKDDERIHMICGMNNIGVSEDITDSYLFTKKGSIWGWASWKRVIDTWDANYSFLQDEKICSLLRDVEESEEEYKQFIKFCKAHKESGLAHYETINGASRRLYNRINIVPKYNMISNIGVGAGATHAADNINKLPKSVQRLLYMKTYEVDFPLKHPQYMVQNKMFEKKMTISKYGRFFQKIEGLFRKIIYR